MPRSLFFKNGYDEHLTPRLPQELRRRTGARPRLRDDQRVRPRTDPVRPGPVSSPFIASRRCCLASHQTRGRGLLRGSSKSRPRRIALTPKPVVPRELAAHDAEEAVDFYRSEDGPDLAVRFAESLERAYDHLGDQPAPGSPRYGHELDLPGVRTWPVRPFPHLVFYLEREEQIDIWRVLHGNRDIPRRLREPESSD